MLKELTPKAEVWMFGVNTNPKETSRAAERMAYKDGRKLSAQ